MTQKQVKLKIVALRIKIEKKTVDFETNVDSAAEFFDYIVTYTFLVDDKQSLPYRQPVIVCTLSFSCNFFFPFFSFLLSSSIRLLKATKRKKIFSVSHHLCYVTSPLHKLLDINLSYLNCQ
jgi:hypothetical protein